MGTNAPWLPTHTYAPEKGIELPHFGQHWMRAITKHVSFKSISVTTGTDSLKMFLLKKYLMHQNLQILCQLLETVNKQKCPERAINFFFKKNKNLMTLIS